MFFNATKQHLLHSCGLVLRSDKLLTILILFLLIRPVSGQASKESSWRFEVNLGIATIPSYLGDDSYQLVILPNFRAMHSSGFFISMTEGFGYNVLKTKNWQITHILKYNTGRFEDGTAPARLAGKETNDLIGLGDIPFTLEPGIRIEYAHGATRSTVEARQGLGGHRGFFGEFRSEYINLFKLSKLPVYYMLGPKINITSSKFNNSFFGITETQSTATGLEIYDTEFGVLSYGLQGTLVLPLGSRQSMTIFANYSRIGQTVANSSLIKTHGSKHQAMLVLMFNYTF
ncbi:MAG: MipA/OmpV family protein [Balneola sp.]